MGKLQGKVAVVTGASKGIGAGIAKALGAAGAAVVVNYASDKAGAEKAVADIKAKGGKAVAVQGDVSKSADVKHLFDETRKAYGKLDVLVNNAGISGSAEQDFFSTDAWHRIMGINATGVFFGIKHAVPAMKAAGGGSIVNLSSIAGIIGSEHVHMAYNASKAAVRLMTKSTAVQHAKDGIRANSVHPGVMPAMRTSGRTADPAIRAERMRVIPMRRPGEVDEVAYAILFLASDESSYITGSEIHVDGGAIAI